MKNRKHTLLMVGSLVLALAFSLLMALNVAAAPAPEPAPVPEVGNKWLQENLVKFPDFYNASTNRTNSNISTTGAITEEVWIEAPLDTDFDGKRDRMRVLIRRPAATLEANGGFKCPAILFLTPYSNNTSGGTGTAFATFGGRVYSGFPDQGKSPTRLHSTAFDKRPAGVTGVLTNYDHWKTIYSDEGDVSYKALRALTDTRIGKGPLATVARYKDLLADGMLDATQAYYDAHPEIVADYPWLPPATTPTSVQTNGNTTSTAPASAGAFGSAATNNARGYAQVTAHMLGNSNAEGFLRYGQYEESIAAAAVVDWLNGRSRAFTTRTSTVEVKAYWATGDCAASGTSYEGTLPVAAAVTGVEGLRTIYPGAPVTNAYNYFRENGIAYGPGGYVGEDIMATSHYTQGRLWSSSAQAYPGNSSPAWDVWWDWQLYQRFEGDGGVGDYSSFWDERNPLSFADDMRKDTGVIMGAGLNDGNVKFRNTGLLNEALKHNGVEVIKGQWSQGQHEMASGMSGAWTTSTNLHLWLDYYLWGIDNGITDSVPNYRIASNISGTKDYDVWPAGVYQKFYPQGGRVGVIKTTPQSDVTANTFKDDYLASSLAAFPTFDYVAIANNTAQVPTQARANGVDLANGFLPNALIQLGQAQSLGANNRSAWRNRIVGGLNNSTTAWSAPSNRFCVASSALAGTFSKTAAVTDRVIYRMDIPENFTISGPPSMTAEVAASRDVGALSCMLVEWWSGGVKVVAIGSVDVRNPNPDGTLSFDVPGVANIEKGGNWHPNYLFQSQDIIPYGTGVPTTANFNSYTWEMDVTEYTFRAGRELCVILYGSDPEFTFMTKDPTEFTVNVGPNTYLSLPIVQETPAKPVTIEVNDVLAKPGDLVDVTYKIKDNASGFAALDLKIPYDGSVYTPQTIKPAGDLDTMFFVANPVFAPNTMRIAFAADENVKNDVLLFTVTYKIADTAPGTGDYPLAVEPVKLQYLSNVGHLLDLELLIEEGVLVIGLLGDVNGDGVVSPEDAILILQMVVGLVEWTPRALLLGDVSGDGVVDTTDAALILRMVVGG